MAEVRIPAAGDPFHAAGRDRNPLPRFTDAELAEAIRVDEARLGRPMTPGEREGFARGFFADDYRAEDRRERDPAPIEERELACPACGHCWHADGYRDEAGVWWPASQDGAYCPLCGVEGEL